jgi:formate hydrogenlyase transcriptional activator
MTETGIHCEQLYNTIEDRIRFERLISDLSARFVNIPLDQVDPAIEATLREILEFFQVDQVALLRHEINSECYQHTHAAIAPGITPVPIGVDVPTARFPYSYKKLIVEGTAFSFSRLEDLPEEAATDKQSYSDWEVRSSMNIPVSHKNPFMHIISIASKHSTPLWPEIYIPRLRLIGEIFMNALELRQTQQKLEDRLKFEEMLSLISAKFVNLPSSQVDTEIVNALHQIVQLLDLDRCVVTQFSDENLRTIITHSFAVPQVRKAWRNLDNKVIPWVVENLMRGKPVVFSSPEDLPMEAARDRIFFTNLGIKSCVTVPMMVSGNVLGFLGCSVLHAERSWRKEVPQGLQLVADVFANAIARKHKELQLLERYQEIQNLKQQLEKENIHLRREIHLQHAHEEIVGRSKEMMNILSKAEQVAATESTVLIQGETGTGKELLAKTIHRLSQRKDRPLVTVNCACLPPLLMEGELFGREKGAYTGALTRMAGRFEAADGSTIFLDEIGELPLDIQSKLLRVLEDGRFERLGSTKTIHVNVRIIAATNKDLEHEVQEGRFRKDLFYRLNVFPIIVPPLRERAEDIPRLVWALVRQLEQKIKKRIDAFSRKSMDALLRYPWPGNVRELRNVIEHAMITCKSGTLSINLPDMAVSSGKPDVRALEDMERRHILNVLEKTGWRISGSDGAAEILGLKRTTLQSRIKKLDLKRPGT